MPLYATDEGGSNFALCPAGNVQAVVAMVCDLGMEKFAQPGAAEKWNRKVVLLFEVNHLMPDGEHTGQRFMLSAKYTLSLHEKSTLRRVLEGWAGKQFTPEQCKKMDIEKLKGKNALVNVIAYTKKDGSEGRKIGTISPIMAGMAPMVPEVTQAPEWVAKQLAENDAAWAKHQNSQPVVITGADDDGDPMEPSPRATVTGPADPSRPQHRVIKEGRVPLSQPVPPRQYPDSPPPAPGEVYDDPANPPF